MGRYAAIQVSHAIREKMKQARAACGFSERETQKFMQRLFDCAIESPSFFRKS